MKNLRKTMSLIRFLAVALVLTGVQGIWNGSVPVVSPVVADASGYKTTVKVSLTYDDNKDSGDLTKVLNLKKYLKKGDSFKKSSVEKTLIKDNLMWVETYAKGKTNIRVVYSPRAEESLDYTCDYSYTIKTKKNGKVTLKFHCTHIADDTVRAEAEEAEAEIIWADEDEDSPDYMYFNKIVEKLKADTDGMSEKDALDTIETYFVWHMSYDYDMKHSDYTGRPDAWKEVWNGTYKGVCGEGAVRAVQILRELGYNAVYVANMPLNHGWAVVYTTDTVTGTEYWRGISATSYAYHIATFDDGNWEWHRQGRAVWDTGKSEFTPYHRQDIEHPDTTCKHPGSTPYCVRDGRFT